MRSPPSKSQIKNSTSGSGSSTAGSNVKGPLNLFFSQKSNEKRKGEAIDLDSCRKSLRERALDAFARWMYDAGLPFNCVNYTDSFGEFIVAVGQYGPGMKPPTYHEVRVPCLKKEVEKTDKIIEEQKAQWKIYGCSIMMDKWTAKNGKMVINVLVNSPRGSVFLESYDASDSSTNSNKMFNLSEKTILKVGPENVVQVVTDNTSENKKVGNMLKGVFPNICWTPCAAHCINLMFGEIFNFYLQKQNTLFLSTEWSESIYTKEALGKEVARFIIGPYFWNDTVQALKVGNPLVIVLRLVDGEKKSPTEYIYEAMDRDKEDIEKAFDHDRRKYERVFEIIDKRWDDQLHQPLHAAGHILNRELFYTNNENKTLDLKIHTKKRNRLELKKLNDLVFVKYNRTLARRYKARNIIDPILLNNIDEANEWLTGGPQNHEEEEVFEGEGLTFGHVAMASGVEENVYGFRGSTLRIKERVSTSTSTCTSRTLINESSDEEEEDDDQYNNSNMMTLQEFGDLVEE
uniref:Uncharacterized protein LOC104215278 n=1 Tax=Nicotiana sylvestris TaxID=4096 RepID=A0A1U7VEJ6_NICSY|nr:PREDICTED: uncharacterized protein LOC104215278 [Nicotiana sylvestris]